MNTRETRAAKTRSKCSPLNVSSVFKRGTSAPNRMTYWWFLADHMMNNSSSDCYLYFFFFSTMKSPRLCFINNTKDYFFFPAMRVVFFHVLKDGTLCVPGAGCVPNMSVFGYLGFRQISCQEGTRIWQWLTHPVERPNTNCRLQLLNSKPLPSTFSLCYFI